MYRRGSSSGYTSSGPAPGQLAEAEVTRLKAKQAELVAAQEAGEKVRAEAQKAALAEAEKLAKDAAERVAALKADLGEP